MNDELETRIRALHDAGDLAGAVTCALRGYGPELYGFLVAMERNQEDATEIFSSLSEDLWRGIEGFRWACAFRTWAYTLARRAAYRYHRGQARRAREVRLSTSMISAVAEQIVSSYTAERSQLEQLRDELPDEDRLILVLRLDKDLSFVDVARVTLGDTQASQAALTREAARVRKRFSLTKERLIERGRALGLVNRDNGRA